MDGPAQSGERCLGHVAHRDEHLAEAQTGASLLGERELELDGAEQAALDEKLAQGKPQHAGCGHEWGIGTPFEVPVTPSSDCFRLPRGDK